MVEKVAAVVVAIKILDVKNSLCISFGLFISVFAGSAQTTSYKKRVLESTEIEVLTSYYRQDGENASVTGGIGTEALTDRASALVINMPLNEDDVLTLDVGISTYTSASSGNLDPFDDSSGASSDYRGDPVSTPVGSPWTASSGASQTDTWFAISGTYEHSSDDRNTIKSATLNFAREYDYVSYGFGGGVTRLFNDKNTSLGIQAQAFLDQWLPRYPTELDSYVEADRKLTNGYFKNIKIYDQWGIETDKDNSSWETSFELMDQKNRNTYALSVSFSQILSRKSQFSLFMDLVQQRGWLANPMQRVYFEDRPNYYVGSPEKMTSTLKSDYLLKKHEDVFQLADDIERLPDTRTKLPIGARYNHVLNEYISLRSYYRYYTDTWKIHSHTLQVEMPIKVKEDFTFYPHFRFYSQTAAAYFAPYDQLLSTAPFYTSDYDLSAFNALQFGLGVSYTDLLNQNHLGKLGLKSGHFNYSFYQRDTGLYAHLISIACKWVLDD
jgi:hypothetical protein